MRALLFLLHAGVIMLKMTDDAIVSTL